jgi:hypothetical protein
MVAGDVSERGNRPAHSVAAWQVLWPRRTSRRSLGGVEDLGAMTFSVLANSSRARCCLVSKLPLLRHSASCQFRCSSALRLRSSSSIASMIVHKTVAPSLSPSPKSLSARSAVTTTASWPWRSMMLAAARKMSALVKKHGLVDIGGHSFAGLGRQRDTGKALKR